MSYKYTKIETSDHESITVLVDGELHVATTDHPHYDAIVEAAKSGDPDILDLLDLTESVAARFEPLSRRVSVAGGTLHFDNEPVHGALSEQVVRFYEAGLDFEPLVNFFEKVAANPNKGSVDQWYTWLERHGFALRPDGDFIAYKGVIDQGDGDYVSCNRGSAIVDGERVNGNIPNYVGAVVEMPRSQVQFDPGVGCSTGLHAGTWDYASGFARGAVLKVAINPADVVSVPTDCDAQKLRVCRYTVLEVIEQEFNDLLDYDEDEYDDDEDWGDEDTLDHAFYSGSSSPGFVRTVADAQPGDRVKVVDGPAWNLGTGNVYTVRSNDGAFLYLNEVDGGWLHHRFELL